ncbi:hypothetical protein [Sphingomonas sp. TDK1]|uniref:hypothetical protein n=1 Tax=Sphingomonas sp. TDK1 TaxID=453247 RepID=UPI000B244B90|nr:hypothetical protein [Sphingomonas sp. TDK1]
MRMMAVAAILFSTGVPSAPIEPPATVDDIVKKLDITSFANMVGRLVPGRRTFADYGFVLRTRSQKSAELIRTADGHKKSFVITSDRKSRLTICFRDQFVRAAGSASPIRADITSNLVISTSARGLWIAQEAASDLRCRNSRFGDKHYPRTVGG